MRKENIYNETLNSTEIKYVGILAFLDIINEHKNIPNENIRRTLGELEYRVRELELLRIRHGVIGNGEGVEEGGEKVEKELVIQGIIDILPGVEEMLRGDFSCSRKNLYEVMIMGLKNRLIWIQVKAEKMEKAGRKQMVGIWEMYERLEGKNSAGWLEANEVILNMDDTKVKRRAGKFREFFENNNEKPTKIFFRLGKEKSGDDDLTQIRDESGGAFVDSKQREKHINDFYGQLHKKRLDRLISIEDFLAREGGDADIQSKKLSDMEKML